MTDQNKSAIKSVGHALLDEIERVSAKRERWVGYASNPKLAHLAPAIAMMGMAIAAAKHAITTRDPGSCISALEDLKGFDSDD